MSGFGFGFVVGKVAVFTALVLLVLVVFMTLVILLHRYFYPYWRRQPVAWMTLLPSPPGKIKDSLSLFLSNDTLTSPTFEDADVAAFLNENYLDLRPPFKAVFTAKYIRHLRRNKRSVFRVLYENNILVGVVQGTRYTARLLHDPPQEILYVDKLTVKKGRRGVGLATRLIDGVIQASPSTTVGLFRNHHRMPWAPIFSEQYLCTEISGVVIDDATTDTDAPSRKRWKRLVRPTDRLGGGATTVPDAIRIAWEDNPETLEFVLGSAYDDIFFQESGDGWVHLQKLPFLKEQKVVFSLSSYGGPEDVLVPFLSRFCTGAVLVAPSRVAGELATQMETGIEGWEVFEQSSYWYLYNYRLNATLPHGPDRSSFIIPMC
jgi:hypothetical protein